MIAVHEEPIETLHRLHSPKLLNYLIRLTLGDRRQAEDLLQETMLRAWQHLRRNPSQLETLQPWLYTVARRLVIDNIRSRKSRPTEVIADDLRVVPEPTDAIDGLLTQQAMREALQQLKPEHREVLVEIYFRGSGLNEVAERLGIPPGTVKSRTHYALRTLRTALDKSAEAESRSAPELRECVRIRQHRAHQSLVEKPRSRSFSAARIRGGKTPAPPPMNVAHR